MMLFVQGDNVKEADLDVGLQAFSFLKEVSSASSRKRVEEDVIVDIKPAAPVYELLTDACSYLSRFFLEHVKERGEFGFLAQAAKPLDLSSFRQYLDTYGERLRIFVDEDRDRKASTLASYQALNVIESYSSWLRSTEPEQEVPTSRCEAFLRSVIQLRAELFEIGYAYESKVIAHRISEELKRYDMPQDPLLLRESLQVPVGSFMAKTKRRGEHVRVNGELLRIEKELCSVLTEMETVLEDLKNYSLPQIGFATHTDQSEVQSQALTLSLYQASKGLGEIFCGLQGRTGVDLALRLHIQNTTTLTDALLSHLFHSGFEQEISSSGVSDMTRYLGSARYALEEILEQIRIYGEDATQA